jgi:hypothetical protein
MLPQRMCVPFRTKLMQELCRASTSVKRNVTVPEGRSRMFRSSNAFGFWSSTSGRRPSATT